MEAASNAIGRCTSRNDSTPMNHMMMATRAAIAAFVVFALAMNAIPLPAEQVAARHDDMLALLAERYVGAGFAGVTSGVFALLLLSAAHGLDAIILARSQTRSLTGRMFLAIAT